MRVQGIDITVEIGGVVVAGQRGATLDRTADTIDSTAKDSAGKWKQNDVSFKSWSADCDGLLVEDDGGYLALEAAYLAGTKVAVTVTFPSGDTQGGQAIITSFPIEAPYDDDATYSVSLMGDGALTKVDAA